MCVRVCSLAARVSMLFVCAFTRVRRVFVWTLRGYACMCTNSGKPAIHLCMVRITKFYRCDLYNVQSIVMVRHMLSTHAYNEQVYHVQNEQRRSQTVRGLRVYTPILTTNSCQVLREVTEIIHIETLMIEITLSSKQIEVISMELILHSMFCQPIELDSSKVLRL